MSMTYNVTFWWYDGEIQTKSAIWEGEAYFQPNEWVVLEGSVYKVVTVTRFVNLANEERYGAVSNIEVELVPVKQTPLRMWRNT